MSKTLTFKISIPIRNGFLGRECNNPDCKRYFKIHQNSLKDEMYCPYCGLLFNKNEFGKQSGSNKKSFLNISVSYKPGSPYRKKYISPPTEKEVD